VETPDTLLAARGVTDHEDRLLSADQPLAELQQRCGGAVPGKLAIPELLELVQQGRAMGLRLAREFSASDGDGRITGYVRIRPSGDEAGGGCEILIENWRRETVGGEDDREAASRQDAIDRATAEFSARLDGKQRLLAGEGDAPDLAQLFGKTRKASGKIWTEYVTLVDIAYKQPLHWRLLDGAKCKVEGSPRNWFARLIPVGSDQIIPRGFELLLVAEQPLIEAEKPGEQSGSSQLVGDALAPALRQPVARIIANADKIRGRLAGPIRQEYAEYASDIASAGRHLAALLDDLNDLEAVESPNFKVVSQDLNLEDVAHQAIKMLHARAQAKSIELVGPEIGERVSARGDAKRILQVVLNLMGNAINYSPEGSTVTVAVSKVGSSKASIAVSDEGPGLSPGQQERVFAKFERLGRSGDGGSGLGLYISRRLAEAMSGSLDVKSTPGIGAIFTLELPAGKKAI
jgi:signal transduction histidine kinase